MAEGFQSRKRRRVRLLCGVSLHVRSKKYIYQNTCPSKSSRTGFETFVLHYFALLCFTKHCSSLHYFAFIASLCFYMAVTTSEHVKGRSAIPHTCSI